MEQYGLIGYPLGHSFSPEYFRKKFKREGINASYDAFPLERIGDFPALLALHPDLLGLNVTIPHKRSVIPYLGSLHPEAESIGAVNCIALSDGTSIGYNTDWRGFHDSLLPLLRSHHTHALILGTGGASSAVQYALHVLGVETRFVSRISVGSIISYDSLMPDLVAAHTLIVNTTPLGTHPDVEEVPPLPYDAIGRRHLLYDLVYNPRQTRFLVLGAAQGAATKNGLEMLELQADASWRIWNRKKL